MAENNQAAAPKLTLGKPQAATFDQITRTTEPIVEKTTETPDPEKDTTKKTGENGGEEGEKKVEKTGEENDKTKTPQGINADQVKNYFKDQGIEWDGNLESLKDKITPKAEPTQEEKDAKATQRENRILNYYTGDLGRKAEEYVNTKVIANAKPLEIASAQYERDLKQQGWSAEQITELMKEQYFQYSDEEINAMEDVEEQEIYKKKKALGTKQLEAYGQPIINHAKQVLKELDDAISAQDLLHQTQEKFSSKVDDHLKSVSRSITVELGESNGQKLEPVVYDLDDATIAEVGELLKDPEKRQQLFFNKDNSFNAEALIPKLIKAAVFDKAVKKALLEGQDREVKKIQTVFPYGNPHDLGVGGASSQKKQPNGEERPRFKSVGKPQLAKAPLS